MNKLWFLLEWHFQFFIKAGIGSIPHFCLEENILEHDFNIGLNLSLLQGKRRNQWKIYQKVIKKVSQLKKNKQYKEILFHVKSQ